MRRRITKQFLWGIRCCIWYHCATYCDTVNMRRRITNQFLWGIRCCMWYHCATYCDTGLPTLTHFPPPVWVSDCKITPYHSLEDHSYLHELFCDSKPHGVTIQCTLGLIRKIHVHNDTKSTSSLACCHLDNETKWILTPCSIKLF
jgi:hypothetical protein